MCKVKSGENYPVITINRQYGACGRSLAKELSQRLDIPYYDRDFVTKTAEESGYATEDVEREGEELSAPGRFMDLFLNSAVSYNSSHDAIFKAQKTVVLDLAESPCIIVGRCANHILREAGRKAISVYLHAPEEFRLRRAQELAEYGDMDPQKYLEKRDKLRSIYYKRYTGQEIKNAENYTFCFNTGSVPVKTCADIIEKLYREYAG